MALRLKIRGKLIVSFSIVMAMVLAALGYITYLTFADSITRHKGIVATLLVEGAQLRLETVIQHYELEAQHLWSTLGNETQLGRLISGIDPGLALEIEQQIGLSIDDHSTVAAVAFTDDYNRILVNWGEEAPIQEWIRHDGASENQQTIRSFERHVVIAYPDPTASESPPGRRLIYALRIGGLQERMMANSALEESALVVGMDGQELFRRGPREMLSTIGTSVISRAPETTESFIELDNFFVFRSHIDHLRWDILYLISRETYLSEVIELKNRVVAATIVVLWVSIWVVLIVAHRIALPIRLLSQAAVDIPKMDYSSPVTYRDTGDEISDLAGAFENMRVHIRSMISRDPLTNAYNRRHLMHAMEMELAKAQRSFQTFACLMLDLDHFKSVNDTFGHQAGDKVLTDGSAVIKSALRRYDMLARYGGEEFTVLLPNTDDEGAMIVAERIRSSIEQHHFMWEGRRIPVTVSIGIALCCDGDGPISEPEELIERADNALYEAKHGGRNRVVAAQPPDITKANEHPGSLPGAEPDQHVERAKLEGAS